MDQILCVGMQEAKHPLFLKKMGYGISNFETAEGVPDALDKTPFDAIIVEDVPDLEVVELITFFRGHERTKNVPILCFSERPATKTFLKQKSFEAVEFVAAPYSIGSIASRLATILRLEKFAGEDEASATLTQMNAALRDFNDKIKKELAAARNIQLSLLPKELPSDPSFEIAALYEPLDDVGGDWYYAERDESGDLAIQIADATGHGLSAAFVCSMAKLSMTAVTSREPGKLMTGMNRLLSPQMPEGMFITAFSCLYSPSSGALSFARAGHPPGLLLRAASGKVEELKGQGFALGFFEDSDYQSEQVVLEPGDVVLIMTDGIPEAQNLKGDTYGSERIIEEMSKLKESGDPVAVLEAVLADFDDFRQGKRLNDDLTMIALKRRT